MEQLRVDRADADGWQVLVLSGPLDVATAPGFRQTLQEAQYGGEHRVALDLTSLEFLDSFGLGVLVGARKRARTHRGELVLVIPEGARVSAVLEATGTAALFACVPDRDHLPSR